MEKKKLRTFGKIFSKLPKNEKKGVRAATAINQAELGTATSTSALPIARVTYLYSRRIRAVFRKPVVTCTVSGLRTARSFSQTLYDTVIGCIRYHLGYIY